ncbi:MAG TPA: apolipoprotein N-acyltransferase [bacterium]|nr:apolipoprotein N-acyltransferase [bacterium]
MNKNDRMKLLISAVGLILAFPPFPFGPLATIVLIPFFFFLKGTTFRQAVTGSYFLGLVWAAGTIYWIGWATLPGVIGAVIVFALYPALFGGILNRLFHLWGERAVWTAPFLWTGVEIIAGSGVLGFPWNSLSHTMIQIPQSIQFASVTGMYGVTFWLVLLNVFIFKLFRHIPDIRRACRFMTITVILILFPVIHGSIFSAVSMPGTPQIRVSLIQGNIDPYIRWTPQFVDSNFVIYRRLTRKAGESSPDLIVWPESAAPCYVRSRNHCAAPIHYLADSLHIPLLTGAPDYEWTDANHVKTYNAAFLFTPGMRRLDRYHKRRLVPFSERVPFVSRLPFLYEFSRRFTLDIGDFSPGDSAVVFRLPPDSTGSRTPFSVLICYDSVFPENVRQFVEAGARFLVIITNDGWFGHTSGPYQHAAIARLRAIENRIWIARSANTGISEIIDPFGRVLSRTRLNEATVLTGHVGLLQERTLFTRFGQWIPVLVLTGCGLILCLGAITKLGKR